MTKKKHEELVEEIAKTIFFHTWEEGGRDWDKAITKAKHLITLILSAVRLDEELGVVGRENVKTIVDAWLDEMILMGATEFIALTATGKEEEE